MDSGIPNQPGIITPKLGSWTENLPEDITPESSVGESTDWFSMFNTVARSQQQAQATYGITDPESGRQLSEPEPDVDAKTLQDKYPQLPNQPAFDKPMPDSVAASIYEHQQDENRIADAKARRPAGFWHGAATMGTQFVADALDPLNIASMFVPVIGEGAFVGEGAGLAARIAGRAVTGAVNADIAQTPLIALKYGQSKMENDDYGAWNAMGDIATGAAMGAVFHTAITGPLGDYLARRMARSPVQTALEADPALRQSALNTAISQAATDSEVEVRPIFDAAGLHAATEARDNFLNDAAAVENIVPGSPAALRIQAIDEELGGSQRLAAIDAELGGVIPAARREALEAERAMVEHGEQLPSLEHLQALNQERDHIIALEGARAEAQRSGLMDAASRSEAEITSHLQAKHAEDYAALEQMAKDSGTDIHAAYQAIATAADAPLEDMERAYQQIRASEAASNGARGGEQPGVPGPNEAAGANGAGQVVGATEPVAAGGAPGEVAGPAGGAGAAAVPGAGAAVHTRPVGELPTAGQGAVMYRGGTQAGGELPTSTGHVWLSADKATAERFAAKSGGTVSEIHVAPGKYFDYRNSAALKLLKEHLNAIYGAGHGVDADLDHGYFAGFEDPEVQNWLKANGYDGWFEHEGMEGGPVSLGLIDHGKMQATAPQPTVNQAELALRQKTAADAAQRAADGEPTAAEKSLTAEAKAATKVEPSADMKQAQQEIDDHMQFFQAAEAAGALTDEDRVALQDLSKIDDDAKNRTNACLQAGACIARGLS